MAIDPSIALMGKTLDTATPVNNYADNVRATKVAQYNADRQAVMDEEAKKARMMKDKIQTEALLQEHYKTLDTREQARLKSVTAGAAQLKTFLDSGDVEGAKNFLTERRATLEKMKSMGYEVDTEDTDGALELLNNNQIDTLKNYTHGILAAGQVYGLYKNPSSENSYLQQFEAVKKAHPEWDDAQVQDYVYTRGQVGKSTTFDAQGNVVNQPGATDAAKNMESAKAQGAMEGREEGAAVSELKDLEAQYPRLQEVYDDLYMLADAATYTTGGKVYNGVLRELGINVPPGAVAREAYMSTVRNEILPQLRTTFGAQFTNQEGERLLATLGDPDSSPQEKKAALDAFMEKTTGVILSKRRRVGVFNNKMPTAEPTTKENQILDWKDL